MIDEEERRLAQLEWVAKQKRTITVYFKIPEDNEKYSELVERHINGEIKLGSQEHVTLRYGKPIQPSIRVRYWEI